MSQIHSVTGGSTSSAVRKLVFSAMGIALAMVTSYIKVWEMPMGGSVTLLSMLFICLIGYWFGAKYGIITGAAYGLLQFVVDPYVLSIPQVLFEVWASDRICGRSAGPVCLLHAVRGDFLCRLRAGRHESVGVFFPVSGHLPGHGGDRDAGHHFPAACH